MGEGRVGGGDRCRAGVESVTSRVCRAVCRDLTLAAESPVPENKTAQCARCAFLKTSIRVRLFSEATRINHSKSSADTCRW